MPARNYVVKQGDCMASIACQTGFLWQTLWDLPENANLKNLRQDPYVLLPGDVVVIPEIRQRSESRPTDATHQFVRKGVPEILHLVITDDEDQPVANTSYVLEVDGKRVEGQTDGAGAIKQPIAPNARAGHLTVGEGDQQREYQLSLGCVDPIDTLSGLQGRLFNLGYYDGPVDGKMNAQLRTALMLLQNKYSIPLSGDGDDATKAKLQELFGC